MTLILSGIRRAAVFFVIIVPRNGKKVNKKLCKKFNAAAHGG